MTLPAVDKRNQQSLRETTARSQACNNLGVFSHRQLHPVINRATETTLPLSTAARSELLLND